MNKIIKKTDTISFNSSPVIFKNVRLLDCQFPAITANSAICHEELYTVSYNYALITWTTPQQAEYTTIYFGESPDRLTKHIIKQNTKYHWLEMFGLKPATLYWYRVAGHESQGALNSFTTLPKPAGKYLFSYAIFSDTHIASGKSAKDINERYFGKLVEYSKGLLIQCILDSKKRNIDLAVITGDLTDTGGKQHYLELREQVLPYFGNTPYLPCIGNHDKFTKESAIGEKGFLHYVANRKRTWANFVFRDHQFILLDSCIENKNLGYIESTQLQWLKNILQSENKPAYLFMHHPSNGPDLWFGVKNHMDFQQTIKDYSCVQGIFCGHIHRNKVTTNRFSTGSLPYVEVPSTVQFPCAYAVVQVFESGFIYNTYKVSRLDLSEMSRDRFILGGDGSAIFTWYSMGGLGDRSFSYDNGNLFRPTRYEVSVTLERQKAVELYQQLQSVNGASLTCADNSKNLKIILGCHDTYFKAYQSYYNKFSNFNIKATISKEGSHEIPQKTKIKTLNE